ncbi:MAG TPA: DinB family protein [Bryobacteraceae bacterium]|nr:DinB family protein [Bryobacteraceae bacterium]
MPGHPARDEAAPYYFKYIDRVPTADIVGELESQMGEMLRFLEGIPAEQSVHRYAPGKWSIRQVVNHINDVERVFLFRALWFARGFEGPLATFDHDKGAQAAGADDVAWPNHVEEFRAIRLATLAFFRNLPAEAWSRSGVASGNPVTVRALAYIIAGHAAHHRAIMEERYL